MNAMIKLDMPSWTWELHGHICPFKSIGYKIGIIAMNKIEIKRKKAEFGIILWVFAVQLMMKMTGVL